MSEDGGSSPQMDGFEFEKNYPKNIFIPLLEDLGQQGYTQLCNQCLGPRLNFQTRNVVPLSSIYLLISQKWFMRSVDTKQLLSNISNKILFNSKIKKKLFHLLVAQEIFLKEYSDVNDFRRRVSRGANIIARRLFPSDQLFDYPNAVIYLLHVFLRVLLFHTDKKGYQKLEDAFAKLCVEEEQEEAQPKAQNCKKEYKMVVKEIVQIFSNKNAQISNLTDAFEEVKVTILQREEQIREKYSLVAGIPDWKHFVELVVLRCFEARRKDVKITNSLLTEWITQFKSKVGTFQEGFSIEPEASAQRVKQFVPIIIRKQ